MIRIRNRILEWSSGPFIRILGPISRVATHAVAFKLNGARIPEKTRTARLLDRKAIMSIAARPRFLRCPLAPFYPRCALQHGIENDCGEATMCKRAVRVHLRVHARVRVHARKCFYSRDSKAYLRSTVYLASICEFHRSANDLRGGIRSKALFRDSLAWRSVARNRDPSNNSNCNNLTTNVSRNSNNVTNNNKINLKKI